ncbi:acyl-CoA dehydrogenase family protein [Lacipirellula limnantheis]|uniref:Acyl-CoA dehydrogenase n=1 Tax=Lacipirellula limnantheis TaxID=2528024 RepID=A0A517TTK0_9BACT|nr:acyl-CoA dehydrogenase [Lacipirellula limnantheis]QDT71699.1 Acyl-CoA dehydrogenase [Lacipirellula limnantheis]
MKPRSLAMLGWLVILFSCLRVASAQSVAGEESQPDTTAVSAPGLDYPATALSALQDAQKKTADAFVVQDELDALIHSGGGGACPSAVSIDAIQALRLMAGLERLANPHKAVLAAFANQKALLDGRVTNEQLVALLRFYEDKYLEGRSMDIAIESTPLAPYSPTAKTWSQTDGPDLRVSPRQLKIVTFNVTEASSKHLGRHFVLLKEYVDSAIVVVDPSKPAKELRYILGDSLGDEKSSGHLFLLQPDGAPKRDSIFEVDTVFTITLRDKEVPAVVVPESPKELGKLIDAAAGELLQAKQLRSPRDWRKKTASFGLPGLDLPVEYGGAAWPASKVLEAFMHAGWHDLNCRDVVGGAHVRPLLKSTDLKVLDIVRQVASGDAYVAITMTEPHAGSDFHAITSTARKVEGGYLLSGEKRYVARLEQATHVIIFTQPASGEPKGLSAFVLPIDTPGLEKYSFGAHGLKGNSFGGMKFKDVRVDDWQMIGADGEGDNIFVNHFRYWRLMQVAAAIGTADRALDMMAERLSAREAYGGPIGRFTHLQQSLGQHTTELRMAKALAREAAAMLDRGEGEAADPIINGLKAEGVEIALQAVDAATRAFGAEGYSDRVDLGDRLQDLNGLRIADGTTDVMRMDVVRRSYKNGKELWDMAVKVKKR